MKKYLLVEARGEFESATTGAFLSSASELKREGAAVEVLLVQNGVMAARAGAAGGALQALIAAGVPVYADEFAMRERALRHEALRPGVAASPLSLVIERMADGWSVLWH